MILLGMVGGRLLSVAYTLRRDKIELFQPERQSPMSDLNTTKKIILGPLPSTIGAALTR